MKKWITIFCVFMFALHCAGQPIKADTTGLLIQLIRNEVGSINAGSSKFRIVTADIEGRSAEGGESKKFYDGKVLRKAVITYYGETGEAINECYFLNGQLLFLYKKVKRYKRPLGHSKVEADKIEEDRFYFVRGKLIRWIAKDGKIANKNLYATKEKEVLNDLKEDIN
jgi:hypothetical protein